VAHPTMSGQASRGRKQRAPHGLASPTQQRSVSICESWCPVTTKTTWTTRCGDSPVSWNVTTARYSTSTCTRATHDRSAVGAATSSSSTAWSSSRQVTLLGVSEVFGRCGCCVWRNGVGGWGEGSSRGALMLCGEPVVGGS
jgi:hypothetical protein